MKKTLFVALVALMTAITAIAADNNPVNMTITLKNGLVITYKAADMDSVRYVGGKFGDDGAIGMKIYLNGSAQSIDYLYSQIDDVTYTVVTTTTFTRVTNINQIETGKRYIIVCESMNGAMGGRYNNTFRALVTNGITLANGTATVNSDSEVTFFELGGTTGNYTLKVGNDYLSNPTSTTHLTTVSTLSNTEKWAITFDNNNAKIKNKGTSKFIYYFQDGGYFDAFTTGTAVQLYVEGTITPIDNNANRNSLDVSYNADKHMWGLEWPHISNNPSNTTWVVKETSDYGVSLSIEWCNDSLANRWTCYTIHNGNNKTNVSRYDGNFITETDIPEGYRTKHDDYTGTGYSRGHLCPSAARLCSVEQNKHTFSTSNIHPQWQNHNNGIWGRMEDQERIWGGYKINNQQHSIICDTLYVVKAATIGDVALNGNVVKGVYDTKTSSTKTNTHLFVPKYFYMAFLARTGDTYKAIALWTEHTDDTQSNTTIASCVISIDELERRTGIDFFCNLPDDIENTVEATVETSFWNLSQ